MSGCSIVVRNSDSWYVGEPQKETIGHQVCIVSADRKVSVAVALSTLVGSSVECQWRLSSVCLR